MSKITGLTKLFSVELKDLKIGDFPENVEVEYLVKHEVILSIKGEESQLISFNSLSITDQNIIEEALVHELLANEADRREMNPQDLLDDGDDWRHERHG